MAVLINDLEVVLDSPAAEAGEVPPENQSSVPAPGAASSPHDLYTLLAHLERRERRVRAD